MKKVDCLAGPSPSSPATKPSSPVRSRVPHRPLHHAVLKARAQVSLQKEIDRLRLPKLQRFSDSLKPKREKTKVTKEIPPVATAIPRRPRGRPPSKKAKQPTVQEVMEPQQFVVQYGTGGVISIKQVKVCCGLLLCNKSDRLFYMSSLVLSKLKLVYCYL